MKLVGHVQKTVMMTAGIGLALSCAGMFGGRIVPSTTRRLAPNGVEVLQAQTAMQASLKTCLDDNQRTYEEELDNLERADPYTKGNAPQIRRQQLDLWLQRKQELCYRYRDAEQTHWHARYSYAIPTRQRTS